MRSTMQRWPLTVAAMLRHGASVHGAASVVTAVGSGKIRNRPFAVIAERTARLSNALAGLGIGRDDRVATYQWNNAEHVEAYFAIPAMGAILHTLNIRLPVEQVSFIARHAQDRVVIVDASLAGALATALPAMETVEHVVVAGAPSPDAAEALAGTGKRVHDYESLLAGVSTTVRWPDVDEDDGAVLCYTTGTTGDPKGVLYSHRSVYLHALSVTSAAALGIGPSDRALAVVPMFHANAWGLVHAAFLGGADLITPDRFLGADELVPLIERVGVTVSAGVPTIWTDVLRHARAHRPDALRSVRCLFGGGSAVPETLMRGFADDLGVPLLQGSGMTETSPVVTLAHPPRGSTPANPEYWRHRTSAGRLLAGVEARVVADDGQVLPADGHSVGEIQYRGGWVTGSYYGDTSAEKFDDGWLRTGDVGQITSDGYVTLLDRTKDVIKSGGEWISSVELETTLLGHPDVVEAAVIAVPDDVWGERPLACVVERDGAGHDVESMRVYLAARIPRWQVPESWTFVPNLPRTSVGKYDKKQLRAAWQSGDFAVVAVAGPARGAKRAGE